MMFRPDLVTLELAGLLMIGFGVWLLRRRGSSPNNVIAWRGVVLGAIAAVVAIVAFAAQH